MFQETYMYVKAEEKHDTDNSYIPPEERGCRWYQRDLALSRIFEFFSRLHLCIICVIKLLYVKF